MKWVDVSLDTLGHVARGRSRHRPRDAAHLYDGPYPFIQTGDVKHAGLYITEHSQSYSEAGLAQSRLWPAGTLCITIAANIAETAILGMGACFPDSVIGFIADENKCDARFIKYKLDLIRAQYQQVSHGAAQDNLSQEKLLSFQLHVPEDVRDQRRIADVLSAHDELIENNFRRMALLEDAGRQLFREWFVRLRFPGHEHSGIVDGLPAGWARRSADSVLNIMSGGTPKTAISEYWNGDIPFFTPKDAVDGFWVADTERTLSEDGVRKCNSALFPKGTVFVTARGTVGKLNVAQRTMAMSQSCYALSAKVQVQQSMVYWMMLEAVDALRSQAAGAVFDAIIVDTFKRIDFVVPTGPAVQLFCDHVDLLTRQVELLTLQNRQLLAARDLLLPRLMSGEVAA